MFRRGVRPGASVALMPVELVEITADNWRHVVAVEPHDAQREFVAPVSRYLCVAFYDGEWHPLAVVHDARVVGHIMWAFDEHEQAHWIGGAVIDAAHQGRGLGREAMTTIIDRLRRSETATEFALSYMPENRLARSLYMSLGFVETGETDGHEVIARLR